jgi:predicted nucleic acid-binding protein
VNLVDSCGWLEYFSGTARATLFAPAIADQRRLLVPTICMLEVSKVILRERTQTAVAQAMAVMKRGTVVALDDSLAIEAAVIATKFRMPTADSIVLATARHFGATVWTQDADFEGKPGVRFFRHP